MNSSLFGIPYRSSEFEVEMLEEASCARTHCCKLCVAPNSRTKTATSFPSIHCGLYKFIFFTDELVWKLVDDILTPGLIDFHCALHSFRIEWLTSDFAAICLCQQWPYLACFLLGLRLNTTHQYKIWNLYFVENFLCCNIAKYFKERSTTHRVIAKIKRVPVFSNHSIHYRIYYFLRWLCQQET